MQKMPLQIEERVSNNIFVFELTEVIIDMFDIRIYGRIFHYLKFFFIKIKNQLLQYDKAKLTGLNNHNQ